jgi:hypothetical protein
MGNGCRCTKALAVLDIGWLSNAKISRCCIGGKAYIISRIASR